MYKHVWVLIFPLLTVLSCSRVKNVDLIITNAVVYSVDSTFGIYQAFAVDKGRIVDAGTSEYIAKHYSSADEKDLRGKFVYPGFIDAHCHFDQYGLGLQEAELTGTSSFEEVLQRVEDQARKNPSGWIIGNGWDQNDWVKKVFPDRNELDRMFPDRPVVLFRVDGHAALVNETALKLAGIFTDTKVSGGEFEKKEGRLTGILVDNAVGFIRRKMPKPDQSANG